MGALIPAPSPAPIPSKVLCWHPARDDKKFVAQWNLSGDSLTRPPRGYDVNHPLIVDIKRKDFIALSPLSISEVTGHGLVKLSGKRFAASVPLMKFLCEALNVSL